VSTLLCAKRQSLTSGSQLRCNLRTTGQTRALSFRWAIAYCLSSSSCGPLCGIDDDVERRLWIARLINGHVNFTHLASELAFFALALGFAGLCSLTQMGMSIILNQVHYANVTAMWERSPRRYSAVLCGSVTHLEGLTISIVC
jgi:hypothetical protein